MTEKGDGEEASVFRVQPRPEGPNGGEAPRGQKDHQHGRAVRKKRNSFVGVYK